jgi:tetratricopeptide (TPR) repeat protein
MGRFEEAIAGFEQSLARNPSDRFALDWMGIIYLYQKRYDDVIAMYQREISIEEAHSPHRISGLIYEHLGNQDLAMTHLERAIALEPQDYEARAALAHVYHAAGRHSEANELDALADEMALQDEEYGLACVKALRGNVDEAIALLEIALQKGLVRPGWARIDPEFAFIRDDQRFAALVG